MAENRSALPKNYFVSYLLRDISALARRIRIELLVSKLLASRLGISPDLQ